ncbi:hypothetical protein NPIL_69121 [Nephila pilipes]|uniref:Uncharacterized protein n=1 Tax=Nephila pilipes TaxID=299642 RepID=A0A8X6NUQ6_NEPPI|nr:hypothetical protein NPIL_69121 [Nephila pilipes]
MWITSCGLPTPDLDDSESYGSPGCLGWTGFEEVESLRAVSVASADPTYGEHFRLLGQFSCGQLLECLFPNYLVALQELMRKLRSSNPVHYSSKSLCQPKGILTCARVIVKRGCINKSSGHFI